MPITITAFKWVPDFAQGQVRDLRVRWALEEAGEAYEVRYLSQGEQKEPPHRSRQPFGQVPTLEDDSGLVLFESGAIVLHIAERYGVLLPDDANARARAIGWMFAALNTVEPPIVDLSNVDVLEADKPWSKPRRPAVEQRIRGRLAETAARLGANDWFEGEFSAGDLLMVSVLRILIDDPLLAEHPPLVDYVSRGVARPAFQRALEAQMSGFTDPPPPGFADWLEKLERARAQAT